MAGPIEILSETEGERGWRFTAQVPDAAGATRAVHVDLAWADYDWWCPDGSVTPAAVVDAVLHWIVEHAGDRAPTHRLDASSVRRMHPDADRAIRSMLNPRARP
jgi:hypothetical protein